MPDDTVIKRIGRGPDLELHIKITTVDDQTRVNLREYVPSRNFYGRGVFLHADEVEEVVTGLREAKKAVK